MAVGTDHVEVDRPGEGPAIDAEVFRLELLMDLEDAAFQAYLKAAGGQSKRAAVAAQSAVRSWKQACMDAGMAPPPRWWADLYEVI